MIAWYSLRAARLRPSRPRAMRWISSADRSTSVSTAYASACITELIWLRRNMSWMTSALTFSSTASMTPIAPSSASALACSPTRAR